MAASLGVRLVGGLPAAHGFDPTKLTEEQERLLSGFVSFELGSSKAPDHGSKVPNYFTKAKNDCSASFADNIKVNQNCLNLSDPDLQGRAQAQNETSIAQDSLNPDHLVASYNDYRRGDGSCGASFSNDRGHSWNDSAVPMSFTRGTAFGAAREYWQSGGDTSVAYDTKGNAYLSCQVFMRGQPVSSNPDVSSAFYVFRSTGNNGASWNFPGRPVAEAAATDGSLTQLLDKQLMTVDNHVGSPYQDRVYVTWTTFADDGTAYIFGAYSKDYGEHFTTPRLVSRDSNLCPNTYGVPTTDGRCNENQFSQPFTGPDGKLYVAWANFNNAVAGNDNRNQMLLARSDDGGDTFGAPVKVGDYYDLPDCDTYQGSRADPFRACVPEKGNTSHSIFRATNYPAGAVNPVNKNQVVVTYGSYINPHSKESNGCTPSGFNGTTGLNLFTGVKTPGACNNDILVSVSDNAGASFTGTTTDPRAMTTANPDPAQATSDQFWQWAAFTKDGRFATSYYDRQFGNDETTGFSDITVSGSSNLVKWGTRRVTSSSMPPPTEFSGQFYGDYAGLAAWDNNAYPFWSDTRPPDLFVCPGSATPTVPPGVCTASEPQGSFQAGMQANDQDVFTAKTPIPTT